MAPGSVRNAPSSKVENLKCKAIIKITTKSNKKKKSNKWKKCAHLRKRKKKIHLYPPLWLWWDLTPHLKGTQRSAFEIFNYMTMPVAKKIPPGKFAPAHVASARRAATSAALGVKTQSQPAARAWNLPRHLRLHRTEMRRHILDSEHTKLIKARNLFWLTLVCTGGAPTCRFSVMQAACKEYIPVCGGGANNLSLYPAETSQEVGGDKVQCGCSSSFLLLTAMLPSG